MAARCGGSNHRCYTNLPDTVSGMTHLSSNKHPTPTHTTTVFAAKNHTHLESYEVIHFRLGTVFILALLLCLSFVLT